MAPGQGGPNSYKSMGQLENRLDKVEKELQEIKVQVLTAAGKVNRGYEI